MAEHVLVLLDESEQARRALEHAVEQFPDAKITALHVIDPIEAGYSGQASAFGLAEEWYEQEREAAEELFEEAEQMTEKRDAEFETAIEVGRPARTAVEYTDEHDVDHVVMGSHGRTGVSRVLLGSVAESVMRRAPIPVTIVR